MANDNRDSKVSAAGHQLRVRWFAARQSPNQPVIVLLHQGLGSVSQWRSFPETLAAATGCAVVGYDRWGHGGSDVLTGARPSHFLETEAREALPEVLDALEIARPIIYGHSDGGSIALEFAASFPDRPLATISEAAHVFSEVNASGGFDEVVAAFETGDLRPRLERHHGANVDAMFWGWVNIWRSPQMQGWRMTNRLHRIRCPLLVMQGTNDEHGSPAQVETIAAEVSGPVETWMAPGFAHSLHLEATDAVADKCAAFLRRAGLISGA